MDLEDLLAALSPEEVNLRAKQTIVRIDGAGIGAGAIVDYSDNVYTVLTNWHVVKAPGNYVVQTIDGRKHQIELTTIKHLPKLDLAILKFRSSQNYQTVEFGDSNNMENVCVGKKACGHGIIDADNALAAVVANYRFILNAPTLDELDLTQEGCPEGKYRARAKSILTKYGTWHRVSQNNACFSKAALDLAHLKRVDFSVIASYGGLIYKIYPQGSCEIIGVDGLGCH